MAAVSVAKGDGMALIVSVDPGLTCGVAIWDKEKLIDAFKTEFNFGYFNSLLSSMHAAVGIVEGQYFHRNVKTMINLVEKRVVVTTLMEVNNMATYIILPSKWQTLLGIGRTTPREMRKELSTKYASALAGWEIKDNNISDAVNLGWYYITHKEELC